MKKLFSWLSGWLEGKKTYIAAGLLIAIGVWGLWSDVLPDPICWVLIVAAIALIGLGDKIDRLATAVHDVASILRAREKVLVVHAGADAKALVTGVEETGKEIAAAVRQEFKPQTSRTGGD